LSASPASRTGSGTSRTTSRSFPSYTAAFMARLSSRTVSSPGRPRGSGGCGGAGGGGSLPDGRDGAGGEAIGGGQQPRCPLARSGEERSRFLSADRQVVRPVEFGVPVGKEVIGAA